MLGEDEGLGRRNHEIRETPGGGPITPGGRPSLETAPEEQEETEGPQVLADGLMNRRQRSERMGGHRKFNRGDLTAKNAKKRKEGRNHEIRTWRWANTWRWAMFGGRTDEQKETQETKVHADGHE